MAQTVLIADVSVASQRLFEMVLTREGYDVVAVEAGPEVVAKVKENHPDLALIDAVMPGIDSYQVCQTLKQDPQVKDVPIIMLAGTYEEIDRQRGESIVGANAILEKPAKSQAIISKVKEFLELQQQVQEAEEAAVSGGDADVAEVLQEPTFVEEEYAFDEDSEEVDLAVESEILDEEAEWEEPDDDEAAVLPSEILPDEIEAIEESEDSYVEEAFEEMPDLTPESAPAEAVSAQPAVAMSEEQLDAVADAIVTRVAAKLGPVLLQSFTEYVLQTPAAKHIVTTASKKLVREVLPDIQDTMRS
jgi:CheY-like chemotaxis protein